MSADQVPDPRLASLVQSRVQHEQMNRVIRILAPFLLGVFILSACQAHDPGPGLTGSSLVVSIAVAGYVLAVLGAAVFLARPGVAPVGAPPVWAQLVIASVVTASSITLLCVQPTGPGAEGTFVGVLFFARVLPKRAGLVVAGVAFVALEVVIGFSGQGLAGLVILGALAGCFGLLYFAVRLREANEQAESLLLELEESRAAETRAAGLAERQRLAREMHDVLAHSLSGLLLQLEGARMLAAENPTDPRLPEVIDRAHRLGKSGLAEARRAIGMLRDDELPGPERLAGLAAQFEKDRGIPCSLTVSGEPRRLGSDARLALYRVAQEALTNITKHACPERVEVHLVYEPRATRLCVEDFTAVDGERARLHAVNPTGYGLTGMRERAELLGGTLKSEPTCSGFRVELDVPA